ncbi:hypothetical protein [Nostoc sp. UHCC 0870]|uniref:hypothetical protein n=1 Tax=Nostoc sp. UHCC 0870 TaxID=2914041 RepID=UPI001EDCCD28|nr:hypothetical protein [Nostoc sp. UHCC 0870]UKO96203.1 hypothetical protein L6494_16305 [Nostoc sp. UHCC 0870]
MNYQKLDASLVLALDEVLDPNLVSLVVFIYTENNLDSTATAVLENLGVSDVRSEKDVFTATLSPDQIAQLSDLPWVRLIRRSQKLHLRCRNF